MNRIAYGLPGHENEFCVNFEEWGNDPANPATWIPFECSFRIGRELEPFGFEVCNRGTRIEILPPMEMLKDIRFGDFKFVFETIRWLFDDLRFETEIHHNGKVDKQ